jgi:cytosine/adenosine deaminase-related metal-dependent hydrolase
MTLTGHVRRGWHHAGLALACAALWLGSVAAVSAQAGGGAEAQGPYGTLVIRDATIIDGTGAPAAGPYDIVIKGDRITQVVPIDAISMARGATRPTGERVIEAKGLYVMPGIIDMHAHISSNANVPKDYIYKLFLGSGVTTVRAFNIGDESPAQMVAERDAILANRELGPRIYVYPFYRDDSGPDASTPDGARKIVDQWHALGVDGVKLVGLPGEYADTLRAIGSQARQNGMGLAVHIAQQAVHQANAVEVCQAGASSVEHHYGYAEAAFTDRTIQDLPADYNYSNEAMRFLWTGQVWLQTNLHQLHTKVIDELLDCYHKTGFTMDPTFGVYEGNRDVERVQNLPWHKTYTLPAMMDYWSPNVKHHASFYFHWTSMDEATWAQMFRRWMEFVNDYKNHGGAVSVGSDAGSIYDLWGFGTIREMELLEQAGFNPLETIHAATEAGALDLGNHQLGVIRPGYLADLVVLTANPLDDVKVLYGTGATRMGADGRIEQQSAVKYTIRGGVVYDSQALLRDVREMVAKAKASVPR